MVFFLLAALNFSQAAELPCLSMRQSQLTEAHGLFARGDLKLDEAPTVFKSLREAHFAASVLSSLYRVSPSGLALTVLSEIYPMVTSTHSGTLCGPLLANPEEIFSSVNRTRACVSSGHLPGSRTEAERVIGQCQIMSAMVGLSLGTNPQPACGRYSGEWNLTTDFLGHGFSVSKLADQRFRVSSSHPELAGLEAEVDMSVSPARINLPGSSVKTLADLRSLSRGLAASLSTPWKHFAFRLMLLPESLRFHQDRLQACGASMGSRQNTTTIQRGD